MITYKELLTFSNLTNLDWHFVEMKKIKESGFDQDKIENGTSSSDKSIFLKDLLKPELFVEGYKDKEKTDPIYAHGEGEEGIAELRRRAGIAMEYLEKWQEEDNDEGSFMGDWEVLYAADNYKVVADYLDYRSGGTIEYSSREQIKSRKDAIATIQLVIRGVQVASVVIPHFMEVRSQTKVTGTLIEKFLGKDGILDDLSRLTAKGISAYLIL